MIELLDTSDKLMHDCDQKRDGRKPGKEDKCDLNRMPQQQDDECR